MGGMKAPVETDPAYEEIGATGTRVGSGLGASFSTGCKCNNGKDGVDS